MSDYPHYRSQLISAAVNSFGRITTAKAANPDSTLEKVKSIKNDNPYNTLSEEKRDESDVEAGVSRYFQSEHY